MKISKAEEAILFWIEKNLHLLALAFVTLLGIVIRISLGGFLTLDMLDHLIPWYWEIAEKGGIYALSAQVGDYNMMYQALIAIMTYLPIEPLYGYKILSCIFDFLTAVGAGLLVWELSGKKTYPTLTAYSLVVLMPTVWLNSAAWGQCDVMFTCFVLFSLYFLCTEKTIPAFICLGIGFACKLQAVFVLPLFLMVWYMRRSFSLVNFLVVPATMVLLSSPAILAGRKIWEVFTIYFSQTNEYPFLYLNYPSFWALLAPFNRYQDLKVAAILLTVAVLFFWVMVIAQKKVQAKPVNLLYLFFLFGYTCVLFLPSMHDRYGYFYEIAALCMLCLDKKLAGLTAALFLPTLYTYGSYMFGITLGDSGFWVVSAFNCGVYLLYCNYIQEKLTKSV